jgi:hypothetical protein
VRRERKEKKERKREREAKSKERRERRKKKREERQKERETEQKRFLSQFLVLFSYLGLRKILVLLSQQRVLSHYPEILQKILSAASKAVDDAKSEPVIDQHAVAAASGHAVRRERERERETENGNREFNSSFPFPQVPYIETMLRKQMSTVSNSLRVLTIHLLAAIHSFQDNA